MQPEGPDRAQTEQQECTRAAYDREKTMPLVDR
jgi:hypothetical protein